MIAILLVIFASVGYIYVVSHTFTQLVHETPEKISPSEISVEVSDPGVISAEIECVQDSGGEYDYYLQVRPISAGRSNVSYMIKEDGGAVSNHLKIVCTELKTLYEDDNLLFNGQEALFPMLALILFAVLVCFVISFIIKFREGDFSYSMAVLGGLILYILGSLLIMIIYCISERFWPTSFSMLNSLLVEVGMLFPIVTSPAMLLLAIALGVSNIWLIRHEGFGLHNLFGALLGAVIIGGYIALLVVCLQAGQSDYVAIWLSLAMMTTFSYIMCYLECMLFSTMICAVLSTRYRPPYDKEYIIILGCAIMRDGTPTPLLRGRIDRAVAFEREQFMKSGRHAYFVPSGGQGSDEVISEAESMKRYLIEQGIPEEQIIKEDKSVNTLQNFEFSKKVIGEHGGDIKKSIAFSTTNYHVFRGYTLAQRVSLRVHGLSAGTKPYFYPNAFVREFIGLLYERKGKHILFLVLVISYLLLYDLTLLIL